MHLKSGHVQRGRAICFILIAATAACGVGRTPAATFVDLNEFFPDAVEGTYVQAITPDAAFAVGAAQYGPTYTDVHAVLWNLAQGNGTLLLEPPGLVQTSASAISDDGRVIVGSGWDDNAGMTVAIRWLDGVPFIISESRQANGYGVSGNGEVAVGNVLAESGDWRAYQWTAGMGLEVLPPLTPIRSPMGDFAVAANLDASMLVGRSCYQPPDAVSGCRSQATWWDAARQPHLLRLGSELGSEAVAVSQDGMVVAGQGNLAGFPAAAIWTPERHEFLTRLSSVELASTYGFPRAVATTRDGAYVVAVAHEFGSGHGLALWSASNGLHDIRAILEQDADFDLSHWQLTSISDVADPDGDTIALVGHAEVQPASGIRETHSFLATMPKPQNPGLSFCDVRFRAPAALSNPGITSPSGIASRVNALIVYGGKLYALGKFTHAGGSLVGEGIASWNGQTWSSLQTGLSDPGGGAAGVSASVFDDGSGPMLYVGGEFSIAGGSFSRGIARWDGSQWLPLGEAGLSNDDRSVVVTDLAVYDDGRGPALFVAGSFTSADGIAVDGLARWDGSGWSSVGSPAGGYGYITSMATYDDGNGLALYVSGDFTSMAGVPARRLAKWDGTRWSEVGGGLGAPADHMVSFDAGDGAGLLLTGAIFEAGGSAVANGLLRWNGRQFETVAEMQGNLVRHMAVLDNGEGPGVLISIDGGVYSNGEGVGGFEIGKSRLLRWNGRHLTRLGLPNEGYEGEGQSVTVGPLAEYDDGTGPAIYAGGYFTGVFSDEAGSTLPAGNIARIELCASVATDRIFLNGFE